MTLHEVTPGTAVERETAAGQRVVVIVTGHRRQGAGTVTSYRIHGQRAERTLASGDASAEMAGNGWQGVRRSTVTADPDAAAGPRTPAGRKAASRRKHPKRAKPPTDYLTVRTSGLGERTAGLARHQRGLVYEVLTTSAEERDAREFAREDGRVVEECLLSLALNRIDPDRKVSVAHALQPDDFRIRVRTPEMRADFDIRALSETGARFAAATALKSSVLNTEGREFEARSNDG